MPAVCTPLATALLSTVADAVGSTTGELEETTTASVSSGMISVERVAFGSSSTMASSGVDAETVTGSVLEDGAAICPDIETEASLTGVLDAETSLIAIFDIVSVSIGFSVEDTVDGMLTSAVTEASDVIAGCVSIDTVTPGEPISMTMLFSIAAEAVVLSVSADGASASPVTSTIVEDGTFSPVVISVAVDMAITDISTAAGSTDGIATGEVIAISAVVTASATVTGKEALVLVVVPRRSS